MHKTRNVYNNNNNAREIRIRKKCGTMLACMCNSAPVETNVIYLLQILHSIRLCMMMYTGKTFFRTHIRRRNAINKLFSWVFLYKSTSPETCNSNALLLLLFFFVATNNNENNNSKENEIKNINARCTRTFRIRNGATKIIEAAMWAKEDINVEICCTFSAFYYFLISIKIIFVRSRDIENEKMKMGAV